MYRISQTKVIADPSTGKKVLESTPIVEAARSGGMDDQTMIKMSSSLLQHTSGREIPGELLAAIYQSSKTSSPPKNKYDVDQKRAGLDNSGFLTIFELDVDREIAGTRPLLCLNCIFVTVNIFLLFSRIEDELRIRRNALWVATYEGEDPSVRRDKRASLTALILSQEDEECMEVAAEKFQKPRSGAMHHIYCDDLH
ncbi:hypothetical protein PVAG01_09942 [Phlyctema vagabunda]|uniref:Uncharacterized protein n=1 Tax=Phlyctema vagabunda TaxID=108571 RepID=A0ABR4P4Q3_9HELO